MTKTRVWNGFALGLIALFATVSMALAAANPIYSAWSETKLSEEVCLRQAETTLKNQGFNTMPPTKTTRYGVRGDYTVAIRCLADKNLVVFYGSGPKLEQLGQYIDSLRSKF